MSEARPLPPLLRRRTILAAPAVWAAAGGLAWSGEPPKAAANGPEPQGAAAGSSASSTPPAGDGAKFETTTLRGKVVWQSDALKRRFDVAVDPDAARWVVCLETPAGDLHPIVKDFRGRGFHLDPKLHEFDWELVVRRFAGSPFVQVVRTYVWKEGKRFEFDYWCDICAIPMYELKVCECCQGPIRFRFREAEE